MPTLASTVCTTSGDVKESSWAHVRRKFFDTQQVHASRVAGEALNRIAELYAAENEIRGRSPDERKAVRQVRSVPLITGLYEWMQQTLPRVFRKSDIAGAISYDGLLEIDNNAAERALRAVAIRRKNYLFAGSDTGKERAATMYCLLGRRSSMASSCIG